MNVSVSFDLRKKQKSMLRFKKKTIMSKLFDSIKIESVFS